MKKETVCSTMPAPQSLILFKIERQARQGWRCRHAVLKSMLGFVMELDHRGNFRDFLRRRHRFLKSPFILFEWPKATMRMMDGASGRRWEKWQERNPHQIAITFLGRRETYQRDYSLLRIHVVNQGYQGGFVEDFGCDFCGNFGHTRETLEKALPSSLDEFVEMVMHRIVAEMRKIARLEKQRHPKQAGKR